MGDKNKKGGAVMKKSLFVSILVLLIGGFFASSAIADDTLVRFKGGIGAIPISNVIVNADSSITVNRNIVRGVNSPGQIWRIGDLDADIRTNGDIKVDGKGLVLAGGNSIGRTTGQSVFATLFCGTTEHSTNTAGVLLALNGDFRIDDVLTPIPPADCADPVLLIRTVGSGNWFAAGILSSHR
jgi:hypothetical protein